MHLDGHSHTLQVLCLEASERRSWVLGRQISAPSSNIHNESSFRTDFDRRGVYASAEESVSHKRLRPVFLEA